MPDGAWAHATHTPEAGEKDEKEGAVALTWIRTHDWDEDDWRGRSACRDSDPDVFFPIGTTGPALEQIESEVSGVVTEVLAADAQPVEFGQALFRIDAHG